MLRDILALPDTSKVWIYQADRQLTYDEIDTVRPILYQFAQEWQSHGANVDAYANVFHKQFFVLMADESNVGIGGCSIDSSVHLMKAICAKVGIDTFNRHIYTYLQDDDIKMIHHIDFKEAYDKGDINDDTLMFDNLVDTKANFIKEWTKSLKHSWHAMFVR